MPTTWDGTACQAGRFWWDRARPPDADTHPLRAVIFGLDALAEIETTANRAAFNAAFAAHGLDIHWDAATYGRLLTVGDERGRVAAELSRRGYAQPCVVLAERIHHTKTVLFEKSILAADIAPRPGLVDLVMSLFVAGVRVAVVVPGRRGWVQPLVRTLTGDGFVETLVTSDDLAAATDSLHALALWELGVTAQQALAVEGSAAGLRASARLGLPTIAVGGAVGGTGCAAVAVRSAFDACADAEPLSATQCALLHSRCRRARTGRSLVA